MADKELIAGNKKEKKDLFNSKPVIFLVSLFCSLAIWCVVSMYETPETERVFQDVKVQMALTETVPGLLNMSVFGTNEFYCDVTVNGKSYLVNDTTFTSDKIIVKPKLEDIRSPGIYDVELTAQLVNASAELSVVSVEPQFITVYFDTPIEKEFELTLAGADEYTLAEDCIVDSMTLRPSTVLAVGPSLEMNYIREIKANVSFGEPISVTTRQPVALEFVSDGKVINYTTVKDQESIYLDVQVSVLKTYDMKIDIMNAPEGLDIDSLFAYSFVDYKDRLTLYVPTESEALMTSDTITVGRIDMSAFSFTQWQTLSVERYNRSIFYDVLPDYFDVEFTLNTDALTQMTVSVPVQYGGEDGGRYTFAPTVENVVLICAADKADALDVSEIYAQPTEQAMERLTSGTQTVEVKIVLPADCDYAWVVGTHSVEVTVAE